MTDPTPDVSLRKAAIVAGAAILVMAAAAVVATDVTIGRLAVPDDTAATLSNIQASGMVFRAGVFSWLIILICDVLAAWGLYVFFKPVNRDLSLLSAWIRLVYAAILGTALLKYIEVLSLTNGGEVSALLGTELLQARVALLLDAFDDMWSFGLVVFGIHLLILGYLVFKSGYAPKFFGVLLYIAFLGYLVTNLANLLSPAYESFEMILQWIFIVPMVVGEVGLGVWLLIRGAKVQGVVKSV
jgi:hypothetical protein